MASLTFLPQVAYIREEECIGCTKCLPACPVDAIVGAGKQLHTILPQVCTGCGLCVSPCPVDCIDLQPINNAQHDQQKSQIRHEAKLQRLEREKNGEANSSSRNNITTPALSLEDKKAYIAAAIARVQQKKQSS